MNTYTAYMLIDIANLISLTLSSPSSSTAVTEALGRPYIKIKVKANTASHDKSRAYFAEKFTASQAFHEHMSGDDLSAFLDKCIGKVFANCIIRTPNSEVSYYTDKNGKVSRHCRNVATASAPAPALSASPAAPQPRRILNEGVPYPFLVRLGVMTDKGKVIQSKYDKFRQINRFLEYVDDIVRAMNCTDAPAPIRVVDFGSGKAYLTFAVHYYLTQVRRLAADITGVDLKADVVKYCNSVAEELQCDGLHFMAGGIADYAAPSPPDLVVALHACDTATDEALSFAVKSGARAILSAPCCQHEVNAQLSAPAASLASTSAPSPFAAILQYGLLRERFSALATDALRAQYLEAAGYTVQLMEFVDAEHTPKNLLIRAVKKAGVNDGAKQRALDKAKALSDALGIHIRLGELLNPQCSSS